MHEFLIILLQFNLLNNSCNESWVELKDVEE